MVSKTKVSAVLIGGSAILGTVAAWITGDIVLFDAVKVLLIEVGAVFGVFGIYGWELFNPKKGKR